ncbi:MULTISPECIES: M48 family metallopeptidase [unclassified Thioalkalivibrio]|uniref:M48 family metallopeptidase n=1 Tax=unclassified Thioalkalivibrio TaxID=2621013 RepID=UPI0005712862|nr:MULTISPECIES: M48 family metallopeptidase [unclassified Thioalkalivibrio]
MTTQGIQRAYGRLAAVLALVGVFVLASACAPRVSVQEERQLGEELAEEMNAELPIVEEPAINDYINSLGRSIAAVADDREEIDYTFYVVNGPDVNAFAVPGGHIYVYRGLIERADDMSELAGVLAHEVGHVVKRHGIDQWRRAQQAEMGLAVVYGVILGRDPGAAEQVAVQVGAAGVFAGYSREAEREADDVAIGYLVDAGIHPIGLVSFFETLLDERDRDPGRVEQFFATHPTTRERVENTQARIDALPQETLDGLARDSDDFQRFRRQVEALPEPESD